MHKNRGMFLEEIINNTINFYKEHDLGVFHKKEIPITFSRVKVNAMLDNAKIKSKSTTDYYGLYNGTFMAFEAKSTKMKSLPIKNIKSHQLEYLKLINRHLGIGFFIIYYSIINKFFMLFPDTLEFLDNKSISIEFCKMHGFEIKLIYPGIIDFAPLIEKNIKKHQKVFNIKS